ncbi:MAG TPA: PAS domain-containing protein [Candidatus Paceibacterota bacterium]|nr:PAS domain-containing protein [Candidatus Paceibacterota bacterium]
MNTNSKKSSSSNQKADPDYPPVLYKKSYNAESGLWSTFWLDYNFKKNNGFDHTDFKFNRQFWLDRLHPEDAEKTLKNIEDLQDGKITSFQMTYRWLHKNGTYHFIDDCAILIKDSKRKPVEIIGSWVDVSKYIKNQKAVEDRCRAKTDELEHLNMLLMKRELEHPPRIGNVCNVSFDPDTGILMIGSANVNIQKFSKQYYILDIIFKDFACEEKDWQFCEISEKLDIEAKFEWKKLYNTANAIRKNIAIETGIKDFFILTTQSIKINPAYLHKPV